MARYISRIHINDLFHLHNFDINIESEDSPHLMLTGKNGSGKTVILNALADHLEKIKDDTNFFHLDYIKNRDLHMRWANDSNDEVTKANNLQSADNYEKLNQDLNGRLSVDFTDLVGLVTAHQKGEFIIAFYQAARKSDINEPRNPTKPELHRSKNVRETDTSELLNFLSDLKIQEALAQNEGETTGADRIRDWFENFRKILADFYEDPCLKLDFNYRNYTFRIVTEGKSFKFTEMSDGFTAILDIVADLILKMQNDDTPTLRYETPGIVLIDEIETHLHLKLQKTIMPLLVKMFPNIQFIVSTHSPFVLSSLNNATAFDLEHREHISDLTEYSYQALSEGYFGVSSESDYAKERLNQLESLLKKEETNEGDKAVILQLIADFEKIPEAMSPAVVGEFRDLKLRYSAKLKQADA